MPKAVWLRFAHRSCIALAVALLPHRETLKAHFQAHPPHTVSQASHAIEKLTGIKLALSACRNFMRKRLGMKCRKMAVIPSKADPDQQQAFLNNTLEPLLEAERQGRRRVFFVDAAHFVMGLFGGCCGVSSAYFSNPPRDVNATTCWALTVTLVMDNAHYQRCAKVMNKAKELGIDLLFLPP